MSDTPTKDGNADLARLILRVSTGGLFMAHGLMKLLVFTPAGTAAYFESIGLPGFLAWFTIAAELLGGAALIAGAFTRIVAVALIPVLLGAAFFGHRANGFFFSNEGGGWEYPVFWAIIMVVIALVGGGAHAVRRDS